MADRLRKLHKELPGDGHGLACAHREVRGFAAVLLCCCAALPRCLPCAAVPLALTLSHLRAESSRVSMRARGASS